MVASIGVVAAPSQGAGYYERDGYYAKDDPAHREASAWAGKGAEDHGLSGPVDPDLFRAVLEGKAPDGSGQQLGRRGPDGALEHRPGRDLTFSAPKSVSLAAFVGGDKRIVEAHDRAVKRTLSWVERNVAETRMKDPETGRMVKKGDQKMIAATFRHDASRNLDPLLHTHSVIANMVQDADGKWRTMSNEKLYASKMLIGAMYRSELARNLGRLGYGIEKTHADGRFEIAGVPREVIETFSTRRAEIEAAMAERGVDTPAKDQRLAQRAALMTRARKRDVDKATLRGIWEKQAAHLGFDAKALAAEAMAKGAVSRDAGREGAGAARETSRDRRLARDAVEWAVSHLSEREAVFARADLLAGALVWDPGAVAMPEAERGVGRLEKAGTLHAAEPARGKGHAHHEQGRGRRAGNDCPGGGRPGTGNGPDARPGRGQGPEKGTADARPAGRGQADPLGKGPRYRRAGLCRDRQDHHAEPRPRAPGETRIRGHGPCALGFGGPDPGDGGRDRERDPAALPCTAMQGSPRDG